MSGSEKYFSPTRRLKMEGVYRSLLYKERKTYTVLKIQDLQTEKRKEKKKICMRHKQGDGMLFKPSVLFGYISVYVNILF